MSYEYFLVGGTMEELHLIARERGIDPKLIRLVNNLSDIQGCHTGRIILGATGPLDSFDEIISYARFHNIEVP